jgi:chemotaxis protein methyltransferase WspC
MSLCSLTSAMKGHRMDERLLRLCKQVIRRVGFKKSVLTEKMVQKAVNSRISSLELKDNESYYNKLQQSNEEFQVLVELLVNNETWFFRDPIVFEFLIEGIVKKQSPRKVPIKILVAPCSSGEEPYSILMSLIDSGFEPNRVSIDACDISIQALEKAEIGKYTKHSFRGKNLEYLDRYFHREGDEYTIRQDIREGVRFSSVNLIDSSFFENLESYDMIFCRNLLIYLHEEAQVQLLELLKRLMHPESVLVVSPSEIEIVRKFGLYAQSYHDHLIYFTNRTVSANVANHKVIKPRKVEKENLSKMDQTLDSVETLANAGQYGEAIRRCKTYIKGHQDSERAYFLLGVLKQAQGNDREAESFFHKAVYLNPKFHQALIYLSLVEEKKGEHTKAALFKQRADRCKS